jgi:oligopeptide/dipeptide ABC transporter ATP-binding protein
LITHDLGVVAQVCEQAIVMYAGQIVERSSVRDLYRQPRHPYAEGLLASMPHVAPRSRQRLASIPGSPPVPTRMPAGCRFHPRCPYALDVCRQGTPALVAGDDGRESRCVRTGELLLTGGAR